jgi:hypothetical protein
MISPTGQLMSKRFFGWIRGSITVTGANWIFDAGTENVGSDFGVMPVTGSGTFSPKATMDGTYAEGGGLTKAWGPLTYSAANALAVKQESVTGKWSLEANNLAVTLNVDGAGAFEGTSSGTEFGTCKLTGKVIHAQPDTSKNSYSVQLDAADAATGTEVPCQLDTTSTYFGPAAIALTPAGIYVGNGYFRILTFHAASAQKIMLLKLNKQP